jgi:acyl carrier protein
VNELLDFVNASLLPDHEHRVDADTPLFEHGLVDSLNILQLIAFVEGKTQRTIADRDVVMSNFRTVRTIATRFLDPR